MPISYNEIYKKAKALHNESVTMLSDLIAAGAKEGGTSGKEGERGKIIKKALKKITNKVHSDDFGNICAAVGNVNNFTKTVWFIGHFDTVAAGEWPQAFKPTLKGNKLYGRGSSDQLAGLVSSIMALKMLKEKEQELKKKGIRVIVMANPHEEDCEGESIKFLLKNVAKSKSPYPKWLQKNPDIMITTEPTSTEKGLPRPYFGHRGRYLYQIKLQGETGHASIPLKVSVAEVFTQMISDIFTKAKGKTSTKFGADTYAFTTGTLTSPSFNAHTELASWNVDLRIAPTSSTEHILEKMTKVIGQTRAKIAKEKSIALKYVPHPKISVVGPEYTTYSGFKFIGLQELPGPWLALDHPVRKLSMDVYEKLFGQKPPYDKQKVDKKKRFNKTEGDCSIRDFYNFSTDLTGLEQIIRAQEKKNKKAPEIAFLGLGSGIEEQAHRNGEYCPVNSLDKATAYYTAFIWAVADAKNN